MDISKESLESYTTDQSIFAVTPQGVYAPADTQMIRELVKWAKESHTSGTRTYSLTCRAGGTCMSGGPLNEGVVISTTPHFNNILSCDTTSKRMWVQAGTWHRDVEAFLAPHGLFFPPYTSSKDICTIGGMVGNNASGEKSFRYGATRENVHSLKAVLADGNEYTFGPLSQKQWNAKEAFDTFEGEIYRSLRTLYTKHAHLLEKGFPKTRKNAAGYALDEIYNEVTGTWNLARLFVGSQGTLGIITEIEIELAPIAPYTALFAIPIDSFENIPDIIEEVAKETPDTIEVYDHTTLKLSCAKNPLVHDVLKHLLPFKAVLLVEYTSTTEEELRRKISHFTDTCKTHRVQFERPGTEATQYHWQTRRNSFRLLKEHTDQGTPVPIVEDISVPRHHLDSLFDEIERIMASHNFEYVFHGHIADGSIRVFPVADLSQEDTGQRLIEMSKEIFAAVAARNGTISTDHNDGIVRTPFLETMYSPDVLEIFKEVKQIFDPDGLFNPGKKINGDTTYFLEHIHKK